MPAAPAARQLEQTRNMPPKAGPSEPRRQYKMGDLVWVRVKGFPWWPGQVMDLSQASAKMLKDREPHSKIISTFGDGQYCWTFPENLVPFEQGCKEYSKQKSTNKKFKIAIEEAQEIVDKRAGKQPVTEHNALDFLNPADGASILVNDATGGAEKDALPEPASAGIIAETASAAALEFARSVARDPDRPIDKGDAIVRFLISWRATRFSGIQGKKPYKGGLGATRQQQPDPGAESEEGDSDSEGSPPKTAKGGAPARRGRQQMRKRAIKRRTPSDVSNGSNQDNASKVDGAEEHEPAKKRAYRRAPKEQATQIQAEYESEDDAAEGNGDGDEEEDDEKEAKPRRKKKKDAEEEEVIIVLDKSSTWQALQYAKLPAVLTFLKRIAATANSQKMPKMTSSTAKLRATLLLHREQRFVGSELRENGKIGADAERTVKEYIRQTLKPNTAGKIAGGVPIEQPAIVGNKARFKEYVDKVPATAEDFNDALEAFYKTHNKALRTPSVDKQQLDLHFLFKAVALKGGYEAVTLQRLWPTLGKAWRSDLSRNGQQQMHVKYVKYLLAFENAMTEGVAERELQRTPKPRPLTRTPAKKDKASTPTTGTAAGLAIGSGSVAGAQAPPKRAYKKRKKDVIQSPGAKQQQTRTQLAAFESLMDDSLGGTQGSVPRGSLVQEAGQAAPVSRGTSTGRKPRADPKVVIRVKFASGMEIPSQTRLAVEMKKYGKAEVQPIPKQNTYLFIFADERQASAAFSALKDSPHLVLRLPEGSVSVFQEANMNRWKQQTKAFVQSRQSPAVGGSQPGWPPQHDNPAAPYAGSLSALLASATGPQAAQNTGLQGGSARQAYDPRQAAAAPGGMHPTDPRVMRPPAAAPPDPRQVASGASDPRATAAAAQGQHLQQLLGGLPGDPHSGVQTAQLHGFAGWPQGVSLAPSLQAPNAPGTLELFNILQQVGVRPQAQQPPQQQQTLPSISNVFQAAGIRPISASSQQPDPRPASAAGQAARNPDLAVPELAGDGETTMGFTADIDMGSQLKALMKQVQGS